MYRTTTILIASALAGSCGHGGGGSNGDDDDVPQLPEIILSTTAVDYDVRGNVTKDTCNGNVTDLFRAETFQVDQVSTGMSVFVDPDIGWVPCDGSVQSFDCKWGNAPSDVPDQIWSWRLVGTTSGEDIDATLTLVVTCETNRNCEPCTVIADYTGTLDR